MDKKEISDLVKRARKNYPLFEKHLDLKKYLSLSKKHLDFGAGYGVFTYLLSKNFPKTIIEGFDPDIKRVKYAKKLYKNSNLLFQSIKPSKKYDSITATFVLHEIKDVNKTLEKLHKSLDKFGVLFIIDFKKSTKKDFKIYYDNIKFKDYDLEEEYKEHNRWSRDEFNNMCKKVGFKTLKIKSIGKHWIAYVGKKN